jgi:hypothetical protein
MQAAREHTLRIAMSCHVKSSDGKSCVLRRSVSGLRACALVSVASVRLVMFVTSVPMSSGACGGRHRGGSRKVGVACTGQMEGCCGGVLWRGADVTSIRHHKRICVLTHVTSSQVNESRHAGRTFIRHQRLICVRPSATPWVPNKLPTSSMSLQRGASRSTSKVSKQVSSK